MPFYCNLVINVIRNSNLTINFIKVGHFLVCFNDLYPQFKIIYKFFSNKLTVIKSKNFKR